MSAAAGFGTYALAGVVVWLIALRWDRNCRGDEAAPMLFGCVILWPFIVAGFITVKAAKAIERFSWWYGGEDDE